MELLTSYSNPTYVRGDLEKLLALKPDRVPDRDQPRHARQRQTRLDEVQIQELLAGYRSGQTIVQLAASYDINRRTASAILKRHGVKTRWQVIDEATADQAVELYATGLSMAEVARRLDTTSGIIGRALKRRGAH